MAIVSVQNFYISMEQFTVKDANFVLVQITIYTRVRRRQDFLLHFLLPGIVDSS